VSAFELSDADRGSAAWASIERMLAARLADLRAKNDRLQTAEETAHLRGQIAEIKTLLSLAEPRPHVD
jgi:hypothetical protein